MTKIKIIIGLIIFGWLATIIVYASAEPEVITKTEYITEIKYVPVTKYVETCPEQEESAEEEPEKDAKEPEKDAEKEPAKGQGAEEQEEEAAAGETVAEVKTGSLIGNFKIYAYCPCTKCCGSGASGITATGTEATEGRTIAVDPDIIPLGSKVVMDGHEYTAEDTGGGIDGYTIDLFMNSHEEALQWGVQYRDIYWA